MPETSIRKMMLADLVRTYQYSNQSFKLQGNDVPIYLEDVSNILGLSIEGDDIGEYLGKTAKNKQTTERTEFYKKYADAGNKLNIRRLQHIIQSSDKDKADDDFKRVFVLFTIGVILASNSTPDISWKYIELVRDVSKIQNFNWGKFTLDHLLQSCHTFKEREQTTLQGNLTLLQVSSIWYQ